MSQPSEPVEPPNEVGADPEDEESDYSRGYAAGRREATGIEERLARGIIAFAQHLSMPDSYWATDSRIALAREVLGLTPAQARDLEELDAG